MKEHMLQLKLEKGKTFKKKGEGMAEFQ